MEIVLIILVISTVALIVLFLKSSRYLKLKLEWLKEDLQNLPNTKESLSLIDEISILVSGDFDEQQKMKARDLIVKASKFLIRCVPCYQDSNEIPTWEQRNNDDFKCSKCNERARCIFH